MSKNNGKAMIAIVLSVTAMVVALLSWIATLSARARPAVHDDLEARPATGPIGMMEKKETEDRRVEEQEGEPEPVEVVANALEADKTENGCSAVQDKEISAENGETYKSIQPDSEENRETRVRLKSQLRQWIGFVIIGLAGIVFVIVIIKQFKGLVHNDPASGGIMAVSMAIMVIVDMFALWLDSPNEMSLPLHWIVQGVFVSFCIFGLAISSYNCATGANGGAKENLPSAILFALLGIPSLLGIILSIVRRKNQDSILQFRKTTYYPVLLTVAVAVGAAAPDMVDVFVSAVFALILTEQARDIWDMWVEKPSSAWA